MGVIPMSQKERQRLELFAQVREEALSLVEVAALLPLSYRQCKRIWKRYQAEGDCGLVHRLRGRASTHRKPDKVRLHALALVREHYDDPPRRASFGPTLAAEMLAKHHALSLDAETLRRWLIADGQWQRHRRRSPHRQRRECKAHVGELVQMDGSHHDWFEGRTPECVLMVLVDDATNRLRPLLPGPRTLAQPSTCWGATTTATGCRRRSIPIRTASIKSTTLRAWSTPPRANRARRAP